MVSKSMADALFAKPIWLLKDWVKFVGILAIWFAIAIGAVVDIILFLFIFVNGTVGPYIQ